MKTKELKARFLVALYREGERNGFAEDYDAITVAKNAGLNWASGQLRLIVVDLSNSGHLRVDYLLGTGVDDGLEVRLTARGVEDAEEIVDEFGDELETDAAIPASDRYVTPSDNQKSAIADDLASLKRIVDGSNEVDDENKRIALAEIAIFEATIVQSRVPTALIERFLKGVLTWMAKIFATAIFSEIAKKLISELVPYLAS